MLNRSTRMICSCVRLRISSNFCWFTGAKNTLLSDVALTGQDDSDFTFSPPSILLKIDKLFLFLARQIRPLFPCGFGAL